MNDIIEMFITDEAADGINAISLVESPAIESDFIALSRKKVELVEIDKDRQILMGPALIPNKAIFRVFKGREYHIFFSKDTVRKGSEMFLQQGNQSNSTIEHDRKVEGNTVVESWIVEDLENDKSKLYGLDVPVGTWMVSMKIGNEELYKKAKEGVVKGFSIEGFFTENDIEQALQKRTLQHKKSEEQIVNEIVNLIKGHGDYK